MAAILEPRLVPITTRPRRPRLELVPPGAAGPRRPAPAPGSRPAARVAVAPSGRRAPAPAAHGVTVARVAAGLVALVVALVVVAGAVAVGRGALAGLVPAAPGGSAAVPADATTRTVRSGDTIWSIARDLRPTGDVRPLVDELVALNGSATIHPGQELIVPG